MIKILCLLSLLLGAVLGIITLIPFIGEIAFWILMCFSAVCVILFMTKYKISDRFNKAPLSGLLSDLFRLSGFQYFISRQLLFWQSFLGFTPITECRCRWLTQVLG